MCPPMSASEIVVHIARMLGPDCCDWVSGHIPLCWDSPRGRETPRPFLTSVHFLKRCALLSIEASARCWTRLRLGRSSTGSGRRSQALKKFLRNAATSTSRSASVAHKRKDVRWRERRVQEYLRNVSAPASDLAIFARRGKFDHKGWGMNAADIGFHIIGESSLVEARPAPNAAARVSHVRSCDWENSLMRIFQQSIALPDESAHAMRIPSSENRLGERINVENLRSSQDPSGDAVDSRCISHLRTNARAGARTALLPKLIIPTPRTC
jgi:hypothetical protein